MMFENICYNTVSLHEQDILMVGKEKTNLICFSFSFEELLINKYKVNGWCWRWWSLGKGESGSIVNVQLI
jgi:hypothetical protein